MSVLLEDLTVCVGDGCANRFADEAGWEGYCPSCLALWDDHAAGEHDPPVDVCLLCRYECVPRISTDGRPPEPRG